MSQHVPQDIQARWPSHEFVGRPYRSPKFGFTYIEARHVILDQQFYYIFEGDSFVCRDSIKCGAPELLLEHPAAVIPTIT